MNETIQQFKRFFSTIDGKTLGLVSLKGNKLTKHISGIYWELLENLKEINGTSAGFHGVSEYIHLFNF